MSTTRQTTPYRILLLGGYGMFGSRISERLARESGIEVIVAGRHGDRARQLCQHLRAQHPAAIVHGIELDGHANEVLQHSLQHWRPALVINTVGPFQHQQYTVAETIIRNGSHYIDLADARDYVYRFAQLDDLAKQHGVCAVSGASTVPALSSAVVDHYLPRFAALHYLDIGINPGNRLPRGLATIRSVLSYCGKPFLQWRQQRWQTVFGWQGLTRHRYPHPIGKRWLSNCDIPDQALLPERYRDLQQLRFRAGLELGVLHIALWMMSWLTRWGWIKNWTRHAPRLKWLSEQVYRFGTDNGAMHIEMRGIGQDQLPLALTWSLVALQGDGPQIPSTPAVMLAKKLARGEITTRGAIPALGVFTLAEFSREVREYAISQQLWIDTDNSKAADPSPHQTCKRYHT